MLQSTVSRRVARLENTLGVSLFEPNSTGVCLTNAGRAFETRVSTVFDDLSEAARVANSAGEGKTDQLKLSVMEPFTCAELKSLIKDRAHRLPQTRLDVCEGYGGRNVHALKWGCSPSRPAPGAHGRD
ncbi:LysR family transcriptional regulator [uncultured Roseobacter sp.]|uniref:LysR family transcriptional regulator n=1 Tax=uncultured Roseobacter sp. TaxID=114847 RepID=UPI00345DCB5B